MKDLKNAATAVDEFLAQETCLDGCIDGTTLRVPAKPPHEVPRETVVHAWRRLCLCCHS